MNKFLFFKDVLDILKGARAEQDHPFIVGGDFNIILDLVIDGQGGNSKRKDFELDLVHLWRMRNPTVIRFTWRQKKPIIQRR